MLNIHFWIVIFLATLPNYIGKRMLFSQVCYSRYVDNKENNTLGLDVPLASIILSILGLELNFPSREKNGCTKERKKKNFSSAADLSSSLGSSIPQKSEAEMDGGRHRDDDVLHFLYALTRSPRLRALSFSGTKWKYHVARNPLRHHQSAHALTQHRQRERERKSERLSEAKKSDFYLAQKTLRKRTRGAKISEMVLLFNVHRYILYVLIFFAYLTKRAQLAEGFSCGLLINSHEKKSFVVLQMFRHARATKILLSEKDTCSEDIG